MTFATKQEALKNQPGRVKNIVIARVRIKGGSSREEIRDALGIGSVAGFELEIPENETIFPLYFLKNRRLEVGLRGLIWKDWSSRRSAKATKCILSGEFGPLTDGFCNNVYWGKFRSFYDTSIRQGVIAMTFWWGSRLTDTSY
jgi:hypothetical protein